jgi:6-phosphogluconolactonase
VTGRKAVEVLGSPELAAARGTELFLASAVDAIARAGRFTVAFSGGSTPVPLFRRIAEQAAGSGLAWGKVHLFWSDERCVPPDHPDSNYRLVRDNLLERLPASGPLIHRIPGELPPEEAARAYEAELAQSFPCPGLPEFDMIWLGAGTDGHTASIFPGTDPAAFPGRTAVAVHAAGARHPRVTLTLRVINNARHAVFLVTGKDKAEVVAEILQGKQRDRYPAGRVAPAGGTLTWLLDREAAGRLVGLGIK